MTTGNDQHKKVEKLDQVAAALDRSELTDEEIEELEVLLGKLQNELDVYTEIGDLFSLGGTGYKRVIRAPSGIGSVCKYLEWRERQRAQLDESRSYE